MTYAEAALCHEEIGRIYRYLSPAARLALLYEWPVVRDAEAMRELRRRGLAVPGALTVLGERVREYRE